MTTPVRCCGRCGTGLPEPTPAVCAACGFELLDLEAIAQLRKPVGVVPVLCPRCRIELMTITDGPGVLVRQHGIAEAVAGSVCSEPCPGCGERVCVTTIDEVLRSAA